MVNGSSVVVDIGSATACSGLAVVMVVHGLGSGCNLIFLFLEKIFLSHGNPTFP